MIWGRYFVPVCVPDRRDISVCVIAVVCSYCAGAVQNRRYIALQVLYKPVLRSVYILSAPPGRTRTPSPCSTACPLCGTGCRWGSQGKIQLRSNKNILYYHKFDG